MITERGHVPGNKTVRVVQRLSREALRTTRRQAASAGRICCALRFSQVPGMAMDNKVNLGRAQAEKDSEALELLILLD